MILNGVKQELAIIFIKLFLHCWRGLLNYSIENFGLV